MHAGSWQLLAVLIFAHAHSARYYTAKVRLTYAVVRIGFGVIISRINYRLRIWVRRFWVEQEAYHHWDGWFQPLELQSRHCPPDPGPDAAPAPCAPARTLGHHSQQRQRSQRVWPSGSHQHCQWTHGLLRVQLPRLQLQPHHQVDLHGRGLPRQPQLVKLRLGVRCQRIQPSRV